MRVFLVQHGEALEEAVNPERPLSEKGLMQMKKCGEFLKKLPTYPALILHSDKKRSLESAEIISFALGGIKTETRPYIAPNDDIDKMLKEIEKQNESVLIAGHMPFLRKLLDALIKRKGTEPVIEFCNGSPLILVRSDRGYVIETYIKNEFIK